MNHTTFKQHTAIPETISPWQRRGEDAGDTGDFELENRNNEKKGMQGNKTWL